MPVGIDDNGSRGASFTLTRDQLIELAYRKAGILAEEQPMNAYQLEQGTLALGMIITELDQSGRWRWTVQDAAHIPLAATVSVYSPAIGLPDNITELLSASFRNGSGNDVPLTIITAERYESIADKCYAGDPQYVYLTEDAELHHRKLFLYPTLPLVADQSIVLSVDGNSYRCIRTHTASPVTEPGIGANWLMYWEQSAQPGTDWSTGAQYVAPEQLRLLYRRPLLDFTTGSDAPDLPRQWPRHLVYRLASDLADGYGIALDENMHLDRKAQASFQDIKHSTRNPTNNTRNKASYF